MEARRGRLYLEFLVGAILLQGGVLASGAMEDGTLLDPELPSYEPVPGVTGTLNSIGSDTLSNLMTLWAEGFQEFYPNVNIQIEGKGSSTAPPSLIEGTAQLGPMSREMKPSEIEAFIRSFGYPPTRVTVALDALAVYVHKDNPLDSISLKELDAVFSNTFHSGTPPVSKWGDLGLEAFWEGRPISTYGRNSASGTYGFFKENVLLNGDFRRTVQEQPGSSALIWGVSTDLFGIGYSGIGYKTSGVKVLQLRRGGQATVPNYGNVLNGRYPLSRVLSIYANKQPGTSLDPLVEEFLMFVLSREGQEIVLRDGYFPLSAVVAGRIRESLEEPRE